MLLTEEEAKKRPVCERCDGKGWRHRVPDNFNPFSAGGWNTIRAMYRVPCGCGLASVPQRQAR